MYNKLPSEIIKKATTFDLMVYDVMLAWEQYETTGKIENVEQSVLEDIIKKYR
jgi:hypothetical protein